MAKRRRLQGAHSDIEDLVFRGTDRKVTEEIGAGILPTPKLVRSIFGASTVEFEIEDPGRRVLRRSLLSETWDASIEGVDFRYDGTVKKTGDTLGLTLEDRWIAILRESKGPVRGRRSDMTRQEFIKARFEEAAPGLRFNCPRLHDKLPIKVDKKAKGKKAKQEAEEKSGKGLSSTNKLKFAGDDATPEQIAIGDRALRTAAGTDGITQVVEEALVCALMDESGLGKLTGGENVLEAEGSGEGAAVGDVETEVTNFLTGSGGYGEGGAIGIARKHPGYTPPQIATTAQRNATFLSGGLSEGEKPYARFLSEAKEWVKAYNGGEMAGGSIDLTQPYEFTIGKKEGYWEGCKRLAKQVNWRLFIVGDDAFLMPETELLQAMVKLRIDDELLDDPSSGVENVDFERDSRQPVTEIEIEALISQWGLPPGSVIELADHGPASIGFGGALPVKAKGGGRSGISSADPAATDEGVARYLVGDIEVDLTSDPADRLATIKCHRPTAPLPEPAAKTQSVSIGDSSASADIPPDAPPAVAKLISEIDATDGTFEYEWGGGHESVQALHERLKGYDCSGYVSHDLWAAGLLDEPMASTALESWGEAGEGEWITIYANAVHAWGKVKTASGWRGFESGGQAHATGWIPAGQEDPTDGYTARHPKGL
jgi:hypothetical protein